VLLFCLTLTSFEANDIHNPEDEPPMFNGNLLVYKKNVFSQNGEDGIIQRIFELIGEGSTCCEFGAWDGIHFSNCRNLILQGWQAIMIEGDKEKYFALTRTYLNNPKVKTVHRFVDTAENSLDRILSELEISNLDLLSIDIDGLDYQIFESLHLRPKVICIEVNAGHDPRNQSRIPDHIAAKNVGQPLPVFTKIGAEKGYELVCYTGNAFFVRKDLCQEYSLPTVSSKEAYENFLTHLTSSDKEWLYLVSLGIVPPYFVFHNEYLDAASLGIHDTQAVRLRLTAGAREFIYRQLRSIRHLFR
jgi:hypothetical protein